jgi:hypothetical protein
VAPTSLTQAKGLLAPKAKTWKQRMQILGGAEAQTEVWRQPPIHTRHGLRNSWFHFDFPFGSAEISLSCLAESPSV